MERKPSDNQIKLVAQALCDPMYLKLQEKQKIAMELMQTQRNNRIKENQDRIKSHGEQFQPAHKQRGQSLNPALKKLKTFHSKKEEEHDDL